jgi:dihydroorotase/N-acyl-D-amino-acid deacylase
MDSMRALVRDGMTDGAFGLSSGLFYVPGIFTPTSEIVELAKVAGALGGIYISHMREEMSSVAESVRETIEIGQQGGLPTQVTHHKIIGKGNWGKTVETLRLIDEARARGVDATIDQYPYTASATAIASALLPTWALEGGRDTTLKRMQDAGARADMLTEIVGLLEGARGGGDAQNVQLSRCTWDPSLDGKRLGDVTKGRGLEPTLRNAAETVLWIVESGGCGGIYHAIDEQDLQRVLRHPATMVASDGGIPVFGQGSPHPRSYGTFARVLGRYVRELKVLTLEDAVRKMTAFPAQRLGLANRGVLREGLKADVTVFDPDAIRDRATFENPHQYSEGVSLVVVNGEIVFENGSVTRARPGQILYGPGAERSR